MSTLAPAGDPTLRPTTAPRRRRHAHERLPEARHAGQFGSGGPDPEHRSSRRGERIALALLLAAAAALYLIGISHSGWANIYYSAAAQAGAESWKAFLFGASDAPASITVDKPPASIWLMALSVRMLGLHPFAIALPQALLGILTVALVHATVRRVSSPGAALLAGAVVATSPIAALVFRYNNPDALLTALIALASYAAIRALERDRLRWLLLVGAAVGLGFLTKQLQAFLPVPGLALGFIVAGPGGVLRRVRGLLIAGAGVLLSAGWWVALVELVPPASRPYIGGSTTNSFLELTLGYNGMGRLLGGSGNGSDRGGDALRLLTGASGLGVGWLLPAAVILGVGALVVTRSRPRTDRARALLVTSFVGLLLSGIALSMLSGIYHSYYCAVLVPALATTLALSVHELARRLGHPGVRALLALTTAGTAAWSSWLLTLTPGHMPLGIVVVACSGLAATGLLLLPLPLGWGKHTGWIRRTAAVLALVSALAGPSIVAIGTASDQHAGSGPVVAHASQQKVVADPQAAELITRTAAAEAGPASHTHWAAATQGSRAAAAYQLATGLPVMPVGGYTRNDPSPTLDQFRTLVGEGRVHWYIGNEGEIGQWVAAHYPSRDIQGTVLYDLSAAPVR